ncbi:unnamed protein product [Enterobius vermicularis]|uniref:GT23 domain-containing protein n=1 Tax=Enterobius vermicularis TaxID=51028 RepID=A0A0N4VI30_ENTVE|nr:unnamed protein product [Enterobius vermicularis]
MFWTANGKSHLPPEKKAEKNEKLDFCRKLICDFNDLEDCGLGCELLRLSYCFLFARNTNRTAILDKDGTKWRYTENGWNRLFKPVTNCSYYQIAKDNDIIVTWRTINNQSKVMFLHFFDDNEQNFLEPNIPKAYRALEYLHSNPYVFFISQYKKFFMRLSENMADPVAKALKNITFSSGKNDYGYL